MMSNYRKMCPDLPSGQRCPLCGSAYVCAQPLRPKKQNAQTKPPGPPDNLNSATHDV